MLSIVLGLTQLFAGIGNLVQIRRRVKRYWLHTLWFLRTAGVLSLGSCSASKSKLVHATAIVLVVLGLVTGIIMTRFRIGQFDPR
ncbi:MAG TPA: hypothetical protein VFT43_15345 [Candidatus Polarisedimenticolia bacterium]|nr:hypothetical protein [Candidatus Polarisedimenticolia bacterium]